MKSRQYFIVSAVLFAIVAVSHLLRVVYGIPVVVGGLEIPVAVSWVGFIVPGTLATLGFRLAGHGA